MCVNSGGTLLYLSGWYLSASWSRSKYCMRKSAGCDRNDVSMKATNRGRVELW